MVEFIKGMLDGKLSRVPSSSQFELITHSHRQGNSGGESSNQGREAANKVYRSASARIELGFIIPAATHSLDGYNEFGREVRS
jgi:hypothetical protein